MQVLRRLASLGLVPNFERLAVVVKVILQKGPDTQQQDLCVVGVVVVQG